MTEGKAQEFQSYRDRNLGVFMVLPILLHPKSSGTIRLQSDDPFDPPLIDPNYLDHPDDVKTFLRGIHVYYFRKNSSVCKLGLNLHDTINRVSAFIKVDPKLKQIYEI